VRRPDLTEHGGSCCSLIMPVRTSVLPAAHQGGARDSRQQSVVSGRCRRGCDADEGQRAPEQTPLAVCITSVHRHDRQQGRTVVRGEEWDSPCTNAKTCRLMPLMQRQPSPATTVDATIPLPAPARTITCRHCHLPLVPQHLGSLLALLLPLDAVPPCPSVPLMPRDLVNRRLIPPLDDRPAHDLRSPLPSRRATSDEIRPHFPSTIRRYPRLSPVSRRRRG
jgi:hypothetical protein